MSYVHTGDDTYHEYHEDDDYKILMPIRSEFLRDSLNKWISHFSASLPLKLGSGNLAVVNVVVADDSVS